MRKTLVILSAFFTSLGILFTILPLGTIALIPVALAILCGFLAFKKSEVDQKKFPKIILIISAITFVVIIGKEIFVKDEVVVDQKFEKEKVESKKEAQKELEDLE